MGGNDKNNNILWKNLIDKLQIKLNIWKQRDLSLEGRVHVIRSVGISKLLYTLEMKTIEKGHIDEIEKILWDFLWKGKTFRFNKRICMMPRKMGGLGLVDIRILVKVKRINWILRFLKEKEGQDCAKTH